MGQPHNDDINAAVAAAVMRRMADRGITHSQMASAIDMTEQALTRRFVSTTAFKLPDLQRIARVLDCTWGDLLPPIDMDAA